MSEINSTRAKTLGRLIESARLHANRSIAECAQVFHLSAEQYEQVEKGEQPVSLPDLEVLALYLKVPMGYFWGSESLSTPEEIDYAGLTALRHRVIGVLLRQLRLQTRHSVEELADEINVSAELINAYEAGEKPIPYLYLEQMSKYLSVPITHFLEDQRGPLGRHEAEQKLRKMFKQLPPEMQDFLVNPTNVSYLETAKYLSEMNVEKLRLIAESILEITF